MASEQEINRRLRSLHQDFDFLLDNNIISAQLYDDLVAKIPRRKYNSPQTEGTMKTDVARLSCDETGLRCIRDHDHGPRSHSLRPRVPTRVCECHHLAVERYVPCPRSCKVAPSSPDPECGTALLWSCPGRGVVRLYLHR